MLPNIFWSRTDYISGAYATKMVAISSPAISAHVWLAVWMFSGALLPVCESFL